MIVHAMDMAPATQNEVRMEVMIDEAYSVESIEHKILDCLNGREAVCLRDILELIQAPFEELLRTLDKMEIAGRIESIKPIGFDTHAMSKNKPGFFRSIFFRELKDITYPSQFKHPKLRRIHLSKCPQLYDD